MLLGFLFWMGFFQRPLLPVIPPMPDLPQVEAPEGAQLFLFPIANGAITAGYRNAKYLEKQGYPHFGIDITSDSRYADILASGNGVVLGTEFCDNSLGNIAVIQYDNVFLPESGETVSLIARYYHMLTMTVQAGDTVAANQAIGTIDHSHEWYNHIHLELDTDLAYPFYTPQVAEASSALLNRYPADGASIIEPIDILVLGREQRVYVHPDSDCCTEKDNPRFMEKREDAEGT